MFWQQSIRQVLPVELLKISESADEQGIYTCFQHLHNCMSQPDGQQRAREGDHKSFFLKDGC